MEDKIRLIMFCLVEPYSLRLTYNNIIKTSPGTRSRWEQALPLIFHRSSNKESPPSPRKIWERIAALKLHFVGSQIAVHQMD